jgi:hypothetical protein
VATLETDYLVVGAGASGMSFIDSILSHSDADVVLVDRRHRPGGHWLDAYPFVRLHQPSANYGVNSRPLGTDRIEDAGLNEGFYEQASAHEICDYYHRVLDEQFVASGRVRFLGMTDYRGSDAGGHHVVSLLDGTETTISARRKLVDATYVESEIPSRHTPSFGIDDGVRFVTPNALVDLQEPASRYTVVGAGKTSADTCLWLQQNGVASDAIRWIKPREAWIFNRTFTQPRDLVGSSYMQLQANWIAAAAQADDGADFARRLEDSGVFVRTDRSIEPTMFRGSTMAPRELELLREIENVVRLGRVQRIGTQGVELTEGSLPAERGEVFVDCTANGVRTVVPRPLFEEDRITLEYVTVGVIPWSASIVGYVEATRDDDAEKNRLCPPVIFTGSPADLLVLARAGIIGTRARSAEPDFAAWSDGARLNPAGGLANRRDDPDVIAAFATMAANGDAVMANFERVLGAPA